MMTATLLLLLASCAGSSPFDTDPSNAGDADTDADSDADSDSDADVTFDIVLPMGGATVTVDEVNVPCDATNVCTATAPGDGTFDVIVEHPTYTFVPKTVTVTDGVPDTPEVTYATGGCASDASWNGTSWCDDWVMSEYGTTVEDRYYDEDYPDDKYDVTTYGYDVNQDGVEDAYLDLDISIGGTFNISGNFLEGFDSDGQVYGYGYVESDLSAITFWFGSGPSQIKFIRVSD